MRVGVLIVLLLSLSCAPIRIPPPEYRSISIHTCVPGADVWLDGALIPDLRGITDTNGNIDWPQFPADVTAFNLHAVAPTMPTYGAVITITRSTEPLIVILGSCAR